MSDSKSNCPYIAPRPHWPPVKSLVPLRRGKEGIDDGSQRTIEHPQGKDGIHALLHALGLSVLAHKCRSTHVTSLKISLYGCRQTGFPSTGSNVQLWQLSFLSGAAPHTHPYTAGQTSASMDFHQVCWRHVGLHVESKSSMHQILGFRLDKSPVLFQECKARSACQSSWDLQYGHSCWKCAGGDSGYIS